MNSIAAASKDTINKESQTDDELRKLSPYPYHQSLTDLTKG